MVAIRRGPLLRGRCRGATRVTGAGVAGELDDFAEDLDAWRFAGRLGPPADAPDACVAPFGGSGGPGFTCGRFAGRLGAIFGAPRFTPGFPADGFGGTSVAVLTTSFGVGFGACFAAAGLAAGVAAGLAAGFAAGWAAGLAALFAAGFAALFAAVFGAGFPTLFGAGFAGIDTLKRRERMPFFSATSGHELHEIRNAAAVAPLVVIPGHDLGEVVAEQHGAGRVNDCGARVAAEVRRDEWFI